ncbi:hypothetical protein SCHPADRAFT_906177 [Schizopora paradoxa]|uniref:B30.2/SPRY domain-containing protein n=1 Tax=Schizopora paradoxa TaxID=27342 RepID=A0A0H2S2S4_9AGAM|nr:hypothetical protein SCHPADRAFT_906177 [Schizopora paradoxa]
MEVAALKLAGERNDVPHPSVQMPNKWSENHERLVVFDDGRGVKIVHDEVSNAEGASAVGADHPVPRNSDVYYYEVTIIDKGKNGHISIGFCTTEVDLSRLPGWDRGSWGYHGDDGHAFAGERDGTPFGPSFTTGDTIGCLIDFKIGKAF